MDGGHALSFVFSRTAGDGIVDFTEFEAYSYFLGYGWKSEDDKNNVQLIVTGAPQTHGQRTTSYYNMACLLYTSPSPRDATLSRMPSSA